MKPPYNFFHNIVEFHWTDELETMFQQNKTSITYDVTVRLPYANHPTFITVDCSLIDKGCLLSQKNEKGKLDNMSSNSRVFTTNEQNFRSLYRELIGIVPSLTIYEHSIFGSDYFFHVLNYLKQIFSSFTKKKIFLLLLSQHKCN